MTRAIRSFLAACVLVALPGTAAGCGLFHSARNVLDVITAELVNLDNIVDAIDAVAPTVLAAEQATPAQVNAYNRASQALHLVIAGIGDTTGAVDALDEQHVAEALGKLAQAWKDYVAAAKAAGVDVQAMKPGARSAPYGVHDHTVIVPEPLVLRGRS